MTKTTKLFTAFTTLLPSPKPIPKKQPDQPRYQPELFDRVTGASDIVISIGDRWGIFGVTRSGKTTLSVHVLRKIKENYMQSRMYVYDSKWKGGDFNTWTGIVRSAEAPDTIKRQGGIQVWQPPINDRRQIDLWLQSILADGYPATIYIDELSSLGGRSGANYPQGLDMILKQGAGLNIGAIICSQEVARIPRTVINQMTHLVRFTINDDYDSRVLDRKLGRKRHEVGVNPAWHSFLYRNVHDGRGKLYEFSTPKEFLP